MSVSSFRDLIHHEGHEVVVVTYGNPIDNAAIECEDCNEVLLDFDREETVQCNGQHPAHMTCSAHMDNTDSHPDVRIIPCRVGADIRAKILGMMW